MFSILIPSGLAYAAIQSFFLLFFCGKLSLAVHTAKCRHWCPEWTILSHVDCFIQGQVVAFQVLLDSLHPQGCPGGILQFSKGEAKRSSWHWIRLALVQCGRTGRNAVLGQ